MKRSVLVSVAMLLMSTALAQTGKEFWFAVPYVDKSHDKNNSDGKQTGPNYFRISTGEASARVEFYNFPGGDAASRNELLKFTIPANSIETVTLVSTGAVAANKEINISTFSNDLSGIYNTVLNKGLYIEASNPVTIYYEIGAYNNTEIFALKGFDALGTDFYPSFQNKYENELQAGYATDSWESVDIVATQDGTDVTIDLPTSVTAQSTIEYRSRTCTYSASNYLRQKDAGAGANIYLVNNWGSVNFFSAKEVNTYLNGVLQTSVKKPKTWLPAVDSTNVMYNHWRAGTTVVDAWYYNNATDPAVATHRTTSYFQEQFNHTVFPNVNISMSESCGTETVDSSRWAPATFTGIGTSTISLNAGQTYSIKSDIRSAVKPFDGIHISATKPISVTAKDDGVKDGWAADVVGDQCIPTRVAGFKYIVPDFNTGAGMEQAVFVRALYDGTVINIAGQSNPVATLNKGEIFSFSGFSKSDSYKYIYGNDSLKPFMCFHVAGYPSGGTGTDTELAGAMLPPVDQYTGSMQASFNQPQTTSKIVLLSRTNEANTFKYKKEGTTVWNTVNPTFTAVNIGGRIWYVSFDLVSIISPTSGDNYLVKNTKSVFHLGILSRMKVTVSGVDSYGAFYGYFSDYSKESIQTSFDTLPGGQVVLYAFGGSEGSYQWSLDKPAPAATTCAANYFDPVPGYPSCSQANPIYLSKDILSIPGMYKYKIVASSPYGEILTSYIQFKVEGGKAVFVPLPVKFLTVTARHTGGDMVTVNWSTASETNNHYFTVERATPGGDFEPVATVAGAGSSTGRSDYSVTDGVTANGVYYYRVRQTDYNGVSSFSETVAVRAGHSDETVSVFPTVVSAGGTISIVPNSKEGTDIMIKLFAIDGQCIYAGVRNFDGGAIKLTAPGQSGLFKLSVEFGGQFYTNTIIINP